MLGKESGGFFGEQPAGPFPGPGELPFMPPGGLDPENSFLDGCNANLYIGNGYALHTPQYPFGYDVAVPEPVTWDKSPKPRPPLPPTPREKVSNIRVTKNGADTVKEEHILY